MSKVVVGQLAQYTKQGGGIKNCVIIEIYDDRFVMLSETGLRLSIITDDGLMKQFKEEGAVEKSIGSPLYKDGKPVMSGTKKIGIFRKKKIYTFRPE